jgi:hypothetical protein
MKQGLCANDFDVIENNEDLCVTGFSGFQKRWGLTAREQRTAAWCV